MAASPSLPSGFSSKSGALPSHAGVALDLAAIESAERSERRAHEHPWVEPIPWKTGDVGAVPPLDVETSWLPTTSSRSHPSRRVEAPAAPARKPATKTCGSGCGCGSAVASASSTTASVHAREPSSPSTAKSCGSGCGCASKSTAGAPPGSPGADREPSGLAMTAPVARKDPAAMARAASSRIAELASILGFGTPREQAAAADDRAGATSGDAPPKKKKLDPKLPGSGIPARRAVRILVWVRRAAQVGFFALFMFFLCQTAFRGNFAASSDTPVRLPYPVEAFLLADPFVAAMTLGATHQVYRGLLWSLGLLAVTLVFGRVFCGWICPFGTLHHFFGWLLPSRKGRGAARVEANKTHAYQRVKYYLMYAFLLASLAGSAIGGLFDPICVAVRAIGLGVIPGVQYIAHRALGAAQDVPSRPIQHIADKTQDALATTVWQSHQFYFHQTWLIVALLIAVLFMNRFIPRFWCRVLCPLGSFLGVFARFALFGMEKDHAKCTDCNLCLVNCQGADSPQGGVKWRQDECHMCLNCENACPEDVIKFRFLPNRKSQIGVPDLQRRTLLATAAAGAAFIPAARIADALDVNYHAKIIRPPGAVEERAFLERCIRCAECMKVCPNNALHPAMFEAGVEGLWTPILIARIGYCEHSCVLCGQVCPTGAIQKITEKEKLGIGIAPVKIGTAFYDHGRCLPWSMGTPCIVCEEFCPTSPKAIWVEEVEAPMRDSKPGENGEQPAMLTVKLQRPHVDPSLCIGCGACEKVCPVQDQPAVYITSVGESRSKTNVILLENTNYNQS